MANTREIRRRIKSVKNTAQITKAMQMVAASKMRKAQQAALAGREYAAALNRVLVSLRERVEENAHPLLQVRPLKKELLIVIATDKGLCGALNTNLLREAGAFEASQTAYVASGRKAVQYLARARRNLLADFPLKDAPAFAETKAIAQFAIEKFLSGEVDRVSVAFTHFVNTLTQKPTIRTLLPISPFDLPKDGVEKNQKVNGFGYIFEPDAATVLDAILPEYINFQIYQMALDSRASEHSARMVAMKSATDNAKQLVKDLTLKYNQVRQAAITTELLEITTAQMALG